MCLELSEVFRLLIGLKTTINTPIAILKDCEPNPIFFRFGSKELTGEYPPETPYTPGTPLPPIRRRVRTAFEFSEFIISGENDKVNTLINIDSIYLR